jgi:uncharacterized alkaline shock family protein YloU
MSPEKQTRKPEPTPVDPISAAGAGAPGMISDDENDTGSIRISENVVAAIVHKYVLEVEGVVRFASGSLVGNIGEFFGRPDPEKNLMVDLENECVNINVTLVLEFGVHIPTVATMVQDVVNVTVQDLEDPAAVAEAAAKVEAEEAEA